MAKVEKLIEPSGHTADVGNIWITILPEVDKHFKKACSH